MEFLTVFVLPVIYAFFASLGFAFLFRVRGVEMIYTSIGGSVGWAVYLLVYHSFSFETDVAAYLFASMTIALFAEIMAIARKRPALLYSTIAIFPIVPGAAILRTMQYLLQSDMERFLSEGAYSLQVSGAIAIGILFGSSIMRLWRKANQLKQNRKGLI